MAIDEPTRAALARLTEREKECLRRRLTGQTAKEMALALGVSPHAVEKRLKMARAKLGLSSSLEAARLIAAAEGAGARLVPQPAGLAPAVPAGAAGLGARRRALAGALPMLLIALLAALPQMPAPVPPSPAPLPPSEDVEWRPASPEEIRVFVADSFLTMDRDRSGYIERAEAPQGSIGDEAGKIGDPVPAKAVHDIPGRAGQAMWIGLADADGDGRVSLAEWLAYDVPNLLSGGKVPANWRGMEAAQTAGGGG